MKAELRLRRSSAAARLGTFDKRKKAEDQTSETGEKPNQKGKTRE